MDAFLAASSDEVSSLVTLIERTFPAATPAQSARESISAAAALTGEAIWHMANFASLGALAPGKTPHHPYIGDYLTGRAKRLCDVPYEESPLGPLRALLEASVYPIEAGPNLLSFAEAFYGTQASPDEQLF